MVEAQNYKQLRWRCHRGMLELDLLLLPFLDHQFTELNADDKLLFAQLLDSDDPELFAWLVGHIAAPAEYAELIAAIKHAH